MLHNGKNRSFLSSIRSVWLNSSEDTWRILSFPAVATEVYWLSHRAWFSQSDSSMQFDLTCSGRTKLQAQAGKWYMVVFCSILVGLVMGSVFWSWQCHELWILPCREMEVQEPGRWSLLMGPFVMGVDSWETQTVALLYFMYFLMCLT